MSSSRVLAAERLMNDFAARTGLRAGDATRRYLWTDAFAVFAFAGLYERTAERQYLDWLLELIERVHHTLGQHRADDVRVGWISGLSESEGERHPTVGGLRIGKPLPERRAHEPYDERLEWERDGQYFHYLTKWMHALNRLFLLTGDGRYNEWAIELGEAACRAFVHQPRQGGPRGVYWKMGVDLSRPVVPSMGQLDPLDGYVTLMRLLASREGSTAASNRLREEAAEMRRICRRIPAWATADPLGIGELLAETGQLVQLIASSAAEFDDVLFALLVGAERGLESYVRSRELAMPGESRLAFRELGLSIGLHVLEPMRREIGRCPEHFGGASTAAGLLARVESLALFAPLAERIEACWLAPEAQGTAAWESHLDINSVMLATSLVPDAYLLAGEFRPASKDDKPRSATHR